MSVKGPFTPRTNTAIQESIFSPNQERLEQAMKGKQASTTLVKQAKHMMREGLWKNEPLEKQKAREAIYNFLWNKLSRKSKIKKALNFFNPEGGKRKTRRRRQDKRKSTRKH